MLDAGSASLDIEPVLTAFEAQGYARLGVVLSCHGVHRLRQRATALMTGPEAVPGVFYQHDSPTGRYADLRYAEGWVGPSDAYRKLEHLELDTTFLAWIENPLFERIAHALLGDAVSLYRAVLWNKAARAGMELPWHQDDGRFWGLDRAPCLQIWTALDAASEEAGCLEVVPGSHRGGLASPEGGTVAPQRLLDGHVAARRVHLPARAGEAILLHNHIWHRSGPNTTGSPRRAIGISFLHGDTRCRRRKRAPRQFRRLFTTPSRARP